MPRPPLQLSDDEARQLVAGVAELEQLYPLSPRDHKPFVRAFLRQVHRITGRTFSPMVYRRLLGAFAPGRTPSTTTIALEKSRLTEELAGWQRAPTSGGDTPSMPAVAHLELEALQASITRLLQRGSGSDDGYLQRQCDFLQQRLSETQRETVDARLEASRLTAELAAAQAQAERDRQEIERLQNAAAAQAGEIAKLAAVVEDARRFAMLAIDEARGETRAWKELWQHAEGQLKEQAAMMETFRRLAYQRGAELPPAFNKPVAR